MRVDRATLTAWLRPIERAPPGAPLCLGSLTIRSRPLAGRGQGPRKPGQVSQKRDTKSKFFFQNRPRRKPATTESSRDRGARVVNAKRFPCGGICPGRVDPGQIWLT